MTHPSGSIEPEPKPETQLVPRGSSIAPAPAVFEEEWVEALPAKTRGQSLQLAWRGLRRHWWQALLAWVVGTAGLMALIQNLVKPKYEAISRISVEQGEQILFGKSGALMDFTEYKQTQVSIVTNPVVISTALTMHPELYNYPLVRGAEDAEEEIRQALSVFILKGTNLIQVSMSSSSPYEAAAIVNAVVDAYLKHALATRDDETERRIQRLINTRDERKREVESKRAAVQRLREKIGSADTSGVKDRNLFSLDQYRRFSEELTQVEIMRISTRARLDQLRKLRAVSHVEEDPAQIEESARALFLGDPRVAPLMDRREKASALLRDARRVTRNPSDPGIVNREQIVNEVDAEIAQLWKATAPQLRRRLANGQSKGEEDKMINETELELSSLESRERSLASKLDQINVDNRVAGGDALELEFARRDMERAETVFDTVQASLDQQEFEAKSPIARIQREFTARPSNRPNSNYRSKVMLLAPVGMLTAVLGVLVLIEKRGGRVVGPDELPAQARLTVLGVVPPLPKPKGTGTSTRSRESAQKHLDEFIQSLDHLRVAILAGREHCCVLITSACGSEGKTTLSAQLAERCANAGLSTLIIDADLRNPTLSRLLDASECPGLSNVLQGELTLDEAVMTVADAGGFHLLPAGAPRVDPSRVLKDEALRRLFEAARARFDVVLVDAPPVLPVPDALTMGRWTDGAVLAVRHDVSRMTLVQSAHRRLAGIGVPIIGAVVNGVRSNASYYGYGSYYGRSLESQA